MFAMNVKNARITIAPELFLRDSHGPLAQAFDRAIVS